ncbi:hypothetical protein MBLNU230_g5868t1 [Neophaeotheca triangularis]
MEASRQRAPRLRRQHTSEDGVIQHRTELSREKDVYKYLHTWANLHQPPALYRHAFPPDNEPLHSPEPGRDTTLAALAQLCALRLRARRCLVTLISTGTEYVLAEATCTMSLQHDLVEDEKDTPWLGTCSFPRSDGLNDVVVDHWRKARHLRELPQDNQFYYSEGRSPHWFIVSDTINNPEYNDRAFVSRAPRLRFFCSVPLRDSHGSVIGSLSVMDDKPRFGVSASEMLLLEGNVDTIAAHLDSLVTKSRQQRSERLIQALGLFNSRKDSLREWWLGQDMRRPREGGRYMHQEVDSREQQQDKMDKEFGVQDASESSDAAQRRKKREFSDDSQSTEAVNTTPATETNANASNARDKEGITGTDFDTRPAAPLQSQPEFAGVGGDPAQSAASRQSNTRKKRQGPGTAGFDLPRQSEDAYARASNLICEAMHVDGVVFVDAKAASAALPSRRRPGGSEAPGAHLSSSTLTQSGAATGTSSDDGAASDDPNASKLCTLKGFATRNRSTLAGPSPSRQFSLHEVELRKLIKRYPNGKVFNFAESGGIYSSSGEDPGPGSSESSEDQPSTRQDPRKTRASRDAKRLGEVLVGARSIAFFPIMDHASEFYRSAVFVWSTTPLRYFDSIEDMTYLSAFAHSMTAEIARLQTLASDNAKATFISSISHELRSPLHGVLAGAELLQETELTSFQHEMACTVSMAGRTLLDTVNNVLDYSKLSSRVHPGMKSTTHEKDSSLVDLARLVEDTVETVVSAHRYHRTLGSWLPNGGNSQVAQSYTPPSSVGEDVAVVLDIEKRDNWTGEFSRGSWTRVITNLVGNALKYTRAGVVTVSLRAPDKAPESDTLPVELVVQDTGIGMSEDFLAADLFTPYRQADPNTVGTGLGLSIVKHIAQTIGARLDIQSELDKGTRVSMRLSVNLSNDGLAAENVDEQDSRLVEDAPSISPRLFHLFAPNETQGVAAGAIGRSVIRTASDWLQSVTTSGLYWATDSDNSVCAILESELEILAESQPRALSLAMSGLVTRNMPLLVLARNLHGISPSSVLDDFKVRPIFIHQPIGPRKLLRAVKASQDPLAEMSQQRPSLLSSRQASTSATSKGDNGSQMDRLPTRSSVKRAQSSDNKSSSLAAAGSASGVSVRTSLNRMPSIRASVAKSPQAVNPSALEPPSYEHSAQLESSEVPNPANRETALLVEDNVINLKFLKVLMDKLKLPYDTAVDGEKALDMFTANPFRYFLILTDISMPIMDGNEATARIRDVEKKRKIPRTTIVAISGVANVESQKTSFAAGVDQYFVKPIRMKDISSVVEGIKLAAKGGLVEAAET